MKIVAYLRVSTDRQADEGLGLDIQEQTIRRWAKAHGHRVVGWYRDEGMSGTDGLDSRVGLGDALAALREGQAQGLVVYRLDRLARDSVLQEQLLREVWSLDGEVFSTAGGESNLRDDPEDPSRKLIRKMLAATAEYERDMIALRMRSGRRRARERGFYAGDGSPPFGYRSADDDQTRGRKRLAPSRYPQNNSQPSP
jgi:DNA invertase Pin-like site-specific DNA recombinase